MNATTLSVMVHESVVEPAATVLRRVCERTGLRWGPTPANLFWTRPPEYHVVEWIAFAGIVALLYSVSRGYLSEVVVRPRWRRNPLSVVDVLIGAVFAICWMSQLVFKALRPRPLVQLCWMLMPCHLITLMWVYVLLTKGRPNYNLCVYLATLASVYHWGPVSAAMFPDWSDHRFAIEGPIFVLHHGLLVTMPIYWAARYDLLPLTFRFVCHFTWVAVAVNAGLYTAVSYLSGLNLNYMLYPPQKVAHWRLLDTPHYRFTVTAALVVISIAFWLGFASVNWISKAVLARIQRAAPRPKKE